LSTEPFLRTAPVFCAQSRGMLQLPTQFCLAVSFCLAPLQQAESICVLYCGPQIQLSFHNGRLAHPINENEIAAERFVVHLKGECVLG
jgi:hypothetical protein